jgi:hypothetical protein
MLGVARSRRASAVARRVADLDVIRKRLVASGVSRRGQRSSFTAQSGRSLSPSRRRKRSSARRARR